MPAGIVEPYEKPIPVLTPAPNAPRGRGGKNPPHRRVPNRRPTGRRGRGPRAPRAAHHPGRGGAALQEQGAPDPNPGGGAPPGDRTQEREREGDRTKQKAEPQSALVVLAQSH